MTKALKSFRLGAEMIRRGSDVSRLPARELKQLADRELVERPAAASEKPKPAARAKSGAKSE